MGGLAVRRVVAAVVAEVAPDELPVVEGLSRFDDDVVVRRLSRNTTRREPLGFGWTEVAAMVTPVVWLVLDETAKQLTESAVTGARAALRRVLRRKPAPVTVPELSRAQLAEVHRRILELARQRGMEAHAATVVADAVVARLALAEPAPETAELDGPGKP